MIKANPSQPDLVQLRDHTEARCLERLTKLLGLEVRSRDESIEAELLLGLLRETNRAREIDSRNEQVQLRRLELEIKGIELGYATERCGPEK